MAGSSFGRFLTMSTFGESHGGAVGVVLDGVPPGLDLCEQDIQFELDRRKPGQSSVTTPRKEADEVQILSGVFSGRTTGTPILLILYNTDARPSAYDDIKNAFRPGHADYTYWKKYGFRDWRGSGRASGRETAGRVAAGAVAGKLLRQQGIQTRAYTLQAAGIRCSEIDFDQIEENAMRAPDAAAATKMIELVEKAAADGDSVGGIIECRVDGLMPGIGEPVFDRLEADLAKAMLSIGGVKGFEIGAGFAAADMLGSEHNDQMNADGFLTNNAGGVLGGISSGQPLVFRVAVKPTSSISREQQTRNLEGKETPIQTIGRHDPCLCPRMVPVVEAMTNMVLQDQIMMQNARSSGVAKAWHS